MSQNSIRLSESQELSSPAALPKERFWRHYSHHHELPISSAGSAVVHGFIFALLIFGGVLAAKFSMNHNSQPLELTMLQMGDSRDPGASGPKKARAQLRQENVGIPNSNMSEGPAKGRAPTLQPPSVASSHVGRTTPEPSEPSTLKDKDVTSGFKKIAKQARVQMQPVSSKDRGSDVPVGQHNKDEVGNLTRTERRQRRWTMIFNTEDGNDYLKQLQALGATLAIPQPDGSLLVIRDLRHPKKETIANLNEFKGMRWKDSKPSSVRGLAQALQLRFMPVEVIALFPSKIEEELLAIELQHFHGPESAIKETHFEIRWRDGKYTPVVVFQSRIRE